MTPNTAVLAQGWRERLVLYPVGCDGRHHRTVLGTARPLACQGGCRTPEGSGVLRRCWTRLVRRTVLIGRLDDVQALDAQRRAVLRALIGEDRQ